ncbi:MAG: hypothetical protein ACP5D5_02750 [Acidithiobacillus sp.]|uniref:hypothetical protein n=1 Tax=Acidithiobacillus sp. TaxID=1872118 RepID=UPI0025BC7F3E|nr:hypothetical protein [Acidithiobacillus sp.]
MERASISCPEGWELQKRPLAWNRRLDFSDYNETREFLDRLAECSEACGYYPNLNFARTYVVVSVQFDEDAVDAQRRELVAAVQDCERAVRGGQ